MTGGRQVFVNALDEHGPAFGVRPDEATRALLADYFDLVSHWNARLHLVAPCSAEEFAVRHVLESLVAVEHLPAGARFADVGSGAGLPAIPCLVARPRARAVLVEASAKKAVFLREALHTLGLGERAQVVNARFEETTAPTVEAVTCRALERFTEMLPRLLTWAPPSSTLLLFGGPTLREAIKRAGRPCESVLIPESEQRFLFVIQPET